MTILASVSLGAAVALGVPNELGDDAALIAAFVACGVAALVPIVAVGPQAAREPVVYYPLVAFPHLAGSSLTWLGEPANRVSLARADLTEALLLLAAGFAAFWLGWYAARGRRILRSAGQLTAGGLPSRGVTIALAVVGVVSLVPLVATGSFGYLREFDTDGPLGAWTEWFTAGRASLDIALAFAAFRAFGMADRAIARPDFALLLVVLALEFASSLLNGYRTTFLLPKLIVLVFIYAHFHHRIPIKYIAAVVLAVLLTFPVIEQYRILSREPTVDKSAPALVVRGFGAAAGDVDTSTDLAFDKLVSRNREVENVAVVMRDTPRVLPYTGGRDLPEALAIALVPRVLWPDKPILDAGQTFPQLYLKQPASDRTGIGPTHFGDFYRNFGFLGVIVGMALLGLLFAALGRLTQRGGLRTLLIVAFTVGVLTRVEDSMSEAIVAYSRVMAPVLIAVFLLPRLETARAPRQETAAPG